MDSQNKPRAFPAGYGVLMRRLPGIMLIASLAAALGLWRSAEKQFHKHEQGRFERVVDLTMMGLRDRISTQQVILAGVGAFLVDSPEANADEFHRYVTSLRLEKRYPGIKAMGFSPIATSSFAGRLGTPLSVTLDERYRHAKQHLADGFPEYKVAQDESCATGLPARTAPVPMEGTRSGRGFVWFLPVYRQSLAEERRAALVGWAYAAIDADVMLDAARGSRNDTIDMDLYDGTQTMAEHRLGDTDARFGAEDPQEASFRADRTVDIGGRISALAFRSTPSFDAAVQSRWPIGVLASGLVTSVLLSGLVWSLLRTRARGAAIAQGMTAALREQAELLRTVIDQIPHFVFWKDRDLNYMGCNARFAQAAGLKDPRDIIGKTDHDMPWTPDETNFYRRCDRRVIDTGQPMLDIEETQRTTAGVTSISTSKVPLSTRSGRVFGVLGIFADVTERKRMEEALVQSEAKLRLLLDSTGEAIYGVDLEGRCTFCNPASLQVLGYERPEDLLGKNMHDLIHHSHPDGSRFPAEDCRVAMAFKRGESTHVDDEIFFRADGTGFNVEIRSHPQVRDGQTVGAVVTFTDITDRKERESLERERGHLKEAIAAMEQVLGIVGHELRTPLAGIRALAEVLLMDEITVEDQTGFVKGIHDEVVRMSGTINDLLEAARINSGHAKWQWSVFRVEEACREAAGGIAPLVDPSGVPVNVTVEPEELQMNGDAEAVRRLVVNLLSNAAKHTTSGLISVHACRIEEEGRPWIRIEVADTGSGIAPEIVSRLGEAFALNAGVVGSRHVQGTGLGLSICKGIAAAHDGRLRVTSAPGAGTTVTAMLRADLHGPAQHNSGAQIITPASGDARTQRALP